VRTVSVLTFTAAWLAAGAARLPAQKVDTMSTASAAVQEYIRAAADSNLSRMAQLLGTEKGNAVHINLPNLEKRMVVTSLYLAHTKVRTLGEVSTTHSDQRTVTTEIALGACKVVIPVTAVHSKKDGWLVNDLDLSKVQSLHSPCQSSGDGNLLR
jgi:hypothetical protein